MKTAIKDVFLLAAESEYGEEPSNPTYTSFKFINGGSVEISEGLKTEKGIGGIIAVHGLIEPSLSVEGFLSNSDLSLFNGHFPAINFAPKSFTIVAGNSDLGFGVKAYGSIPSEISLEGKVGEAVKYSVKYEAMFVETLTTLPSPTSPTKTGILMWHDGIVSINGSNYHVSEFKLTFKQTIHLTADISSAKPAGRKRGRHIIAWGFPEVEFSAKIFVPFPTGIAQDSPLTVDVVIALGNTTYNLNDMWIEKTSYPVKGGDDLWVMDISLKGHESCLSIS